MNPSNSTNYDKTQTVVGVFDRDDDVSKAINDLKVAGFTPESISMVSKDRNVRADQLDTDHNEGGQGALAGAIGGGTLGAVLGWLLAGGALLIPGIGPVIAAGIFGATVGGALIGGTIGAIGGALVGQGVPAEDAAEYEGYVKEGRTLLTVNAPTGQMVQSAYDIFERNGANYTRRYDAENTNRDSNAPSGIETQKSDSGEGFGYNDNRIAYTEGENISDTSTLPYTGTGMNPRIGRDENPPYSSDDDLSSNRPGYNQNPRI